MANLQYKQAENNRHFSQKDEYYIRLNMALTRLRILKNQMIMFGMILLN